MFTLPDLPYAYEALEPFVDAETMHLHHDKHHAAYVNNLNDALKDTPELLDTDVNVLISDLSKVPEPVRTKVRNNAGGVSNHNMFWKIMCPPGTTDADIEPIEKMLENFGGLNGFKEKFQAAALSRFGSGWIWLVKGNSGNLEIIDTPNQDSPLMEAKGTPLLCLDVWEHAYYLKYKNVRADYVTAWWNVVNWKEVRTLYDGLQ